MARFPKQPCRGASARREQCFSRVINALAKVTQQFGDLANHSYPVGQTRERREHCSFDALICQCDHMPVISYC